MLFRAGILVVGLVANAAPSAADWLVLRDGSRLETNGPWTVRDKRITFTLKQGGLSSLRSADVDLEASALATRSAREAAEQPAAPVAVKKKAPVLVLTDDDVRNVGESEAGGGNSADPTDAAATDAAEPKPGAVVVTDWDRALAASGQESEVTGTIRNTGKDLATSISVSVRAFAEDGKLAGTADAQLSTTVLPPGGNADFKAVFPGVHTIIGVKFDVAFAPVAMSEGEAPPPQ